MMTKIGNKGQADSEVTFALVSTYQQYQTKEGEKGLVMYVASSKFAMGGKEVSAEWAS